ncbi:MAG: polymerase subunit delta [Actinomycetota bacterium]|nr:polymerase subunit delta [Actinomycetota bacterium]
MFADVIGQERAVENLRSASERPSHAYLLVGPRGSGVVDAARDFAALLIGVEHDERGRRLVRRALHPDVVEFEPKGSTYLVDEVRNRILPEAMRAPIEADRRVLILFEAERLGGAGVRNESANAMLKTLEEPPPRTIVLLVTAAADDLLPTIRSRCQRIDFDLVTDDTLLEVLEREGIRSDVAVTAVALSGGQLARARALAGPLAPMRAAFASAASRVDGTGATAFALAEELNAAVEEAAEQVTQAHADELRELEAELERLGYDERGADQLRRRIEDRQKREVRRARIDLMLEGVTALETVFRDALADPAPPLNQDRPRVVLAPRSAAAALDVCREAREAILINEKGLVRLTHLLLSLPPSRAG